MTQPVDVAYVDLVARTKEFRKDLKNIIDREVSELERELTRSLDRIDGEFRDLGDTVDNTLSNIDDIIMETSRVLESDLGDAIDDVRVKIEDLGDEVDDDFKRKFRNFTDAWDEFDRTGTQRIGDALKRVRGGLDDLGDTVLSVGRGIGSTLIGGLTAIPPLLLPIAIALPPLIGLLTTLGAVVSNAAGVFALLPAGLTALLAIIAPLIIGFQGFGDALGAVMEKDPEKLKEALEGLAPAARGVVLEFRNLLPLFTQIGDVVQQELFKPLAGDLTNVMNAVRGPLLAGLASVAGVLGDIISDLAGIAASPAGVETIAAVFASVTSILQTLRPAIAEVVRAFLPVIQQSLPFLERFAGLIADLLTRFAAFLDESTKGDDFTNFIDGAVKSLGTLVDLADSVIAFFGALFTPETVALGQLVVALFTQIIDDFTAFLKTPTGQRFLEDLAILALAAAGALSFLLTVLGFIFASITLFIGEIVRLVAIATGALDEFENAANVAGQNIVNAIGAIPEKLKAFASNFSQAGLELIQSFIGGFRRAGNFISDVAGDIVAGIKAGLNRFIASINNGIAALDLLLPFSLSRIPSLATGGVVHAQRGGVLAQVAEGGEDEVVSPLSTLEDMISDATGGQPSIVFGPGSINVNFSGVVPTEDEAAQAGRAVGEGIISTLARRGVRLQVRAI